MADATYRPGIVPQNLTLTEVQQAFRGLLRLMATPNTSTTPNEHGDTHVPGGSDDVFDDLVVGSGCGLMLDDTDKTILQWDRSPATPSTPALIGTLQLREWFNYVSPSCPPDTTFSMSASNEVQIAEHGCGSPFMFFNINKSDIEGRKIYLNWSMDSPFDSQCIMVEPNLDRTTINTPPSTDWQWIYDDPTVTLLQTLASNPDVTGTKEFSSVIDTSAATGDQVCIVLQMRDISGVATTLTLKLREISIYEADENTLVDRFTPSAVTMEVTGTTGDYGLCED